MKLCASCQNKYPDDANFCPREECATPDGPHRLTPIAPDPPPPAGAGRFVQISRLGGGASGEVWQASDSQTGGAVAYKSVTAEALPTTVASDRALRELRQLQRTGSPRIVKVIDFGKTPEGRVFVVSELAEGEPLDQVVGRNGPFTLERAKRIVAQIGEALLDAQKVGVVHRDLSAKNVLVSGDDEVRIINFAIARPFTETVFGIPEFMSPEQAEGKLIDQRSNTYGVGALLYFVLTGEPPHVGATPQATIDAILKGDLTPPSIKRPGAGLTAEVDRVVLKALERSSSRRPLTLRQFLADVAALVVTEQTATNPAAGAQSKEPGFAKTMVFAGGSQEVQKLVAQAIAAREAAGPAAAAVAPAAATTVGIGPSRLPAAEPVAGGRPSGGLPTGTPAPVPRPPHGAAVAATMIAMPASGGKTPSPTQTGEPTPSIATVSQAGAAGAAATNFRETLWFKKGDVDQMVADARAKVAALAEAKDKEAKVKAAEDLSASHPIVVPPAEEAKPLEDRYLDDGTLTADDRKKFSLSRGSGPTSTSQSARNAAVPGERMSDNEVLDEIGGGKRVAIIGIVAAVLVALIAVIVVVARGKGKTEPNKAATMATNPAPPQKVEPPPPPAVPPPPAPTAGSNGKESDTAAAPAARPAAPHKKAVVKKKPPPPPPKKHK